MVDGGPGIPLSSHGGLVGRDEELAVVGAALDQGGCVVTGPAGVGKTRLAAEAARAHAGGRSVLRALATASARAVPFGAFSHLLGSGTATDGSAIPAFIETLRRRYGEAPPTLVVDDAHLLDDASSALVLAVATSGAASLLVTVRSFEPTPDAIVALWKERHVERIDLQPLSRGDVRRLVEDLLGGPAHVVLHERVYELSQGNPLYVCELVAEGRRTGALEQRDGRWHADDDHWGLGRLRDVIWARIHALSEDARHALEILAVGAPLRLADLEQLVPPRAVEELERVGLAAVANDRWPPELDLAHPLHGEVVAATMPATVARRVRRELAHVLTRRQDGNVSDALRVATWLLEAGDVDTDRFLAASAHALRSGAPHLAERLAAAAGDGLHAALRLAWARIGLSRFEDVEPVLAPWESAAAAASPAVRAEYVGARSRGALRGNVSDDEVAALLDRAEPWDDSADWRALLATQRAWAAVYGRRPMTAGELLDPHIDNDDLPPLRRFYVLTAALYGSEQLGSVAYCERICERLRHLLATFDDAPWDAQQLAVIIDTYPSLRAGRDLAGVAEHAERARADAESAGNRTLGGVLLNFLGIVALRRGHAADAVRLLSDALDRVTQADQLNITDWIMSDLAQAHALAGDVDGANRVLASVEARVNGRVRHAYRIQPALEKARASIEAASGRVAAARQRLLAVAEGAGEELATEAEVLHAAVRLGADPQRCRGRLTALGDTTGNDLFHLYADHAAALAAQDPNALLAAAQRFEERGLDLFAAEAATHAATAYRRGGLRHGARRAGAVTSRCATRCQGAVTPTLATVPEASPLTDREREVSGLAALGLSNAEIAGTLVLSVRSVETYVLRACRKLGASSRRELASLLGVGRVRPPQ